MKRWLYGGRKVGVDLPLDQSYREMRIGPGSRKDGESFLPPGTIRISL